MRFLPMDLERRILNPKQTRANNNVFKLNAWIYRYFTPLKNGGFLQTKSLNVSDISRTSIAVRHTKLNSQIDNVYIAYIRNGVAGYIYSKYDVRLDKQIWKEGTGLDVKADDISIAFNGRYVNNEESMSEFVTDENFWYFWCKDGVCYANQLFSNQDDIMLASSNCSRVAAIKCFSSEDGKFDFGLIVFMVLNGQLYYRQFSNEEWYDGELVSEVSQYILTDIAVARTNDFRIVVQCMDNNGIIHELFTQYQAFAKYNTEQMIGLFSVSENSSLIEVSYHDSYVNTENMQASFIANQSTLYDISEVSIVSIRNESEYNKKVVVTLDRNSLDPDSVTNSRLNWKMVDSDGNIFIPRSVSLSGYEVTLTFTNFNLAVGACSVSYTGTSIEYLNGNPINNLSSVSFIPTNLSPSGSYPVVTSVSSTGNDGTGLVIIFNQDIINTSDFSSNLEFFTVKIKEYDYYNGTTTYNTRIPSSISYVDSRTITLGFNSGNQNSIQNAESVLLSYDAGGNIQSIYGDLRSFTTEYPISGMDKKIGQRDIEQMISSFNVNQSLLQEVSYQDSYVNSEYMSGSFGTINTSTLIDTREQ